jgi:hypothetical protein
MDELITFSSGSRENISDYTAVRLTIQVEENAGLSKLFFSKKMFDIMTITVVIIQVVIKSTKWTFEFMFIPLDRIGSKQIEPI